MGKSSNNLIHRLKQALKKCFELNKNTGEIFTKLPSEENNVYKLFVNTLDGGRVPLSGFTGVLANVVHTQKRLPNTSTALRVKKSLIKKKIIIHDTSNSNRQLFKKSLNG